MKYTKIRLWCCYMAWRLQYRHAFNEAFCMQWLL